MNASKLSCALIFVCFGVAICATDATNWPKAMEAGKIAASKSDWATAAAAFQNAANSALLFAPHDPRTPQTFNNLGIALLRQNKLTDAESWLQRGWKQAEGAHGSTSPQVFLVLCNLGDCYFAEKKYGSAEDVYSRAFAFSESFRTRNPAAYAILATALGASCEAQQKYQDAANYYQKAQMTLGSPLINPIHPDLAKAFDDQGRANAKMGNMNRANTCFDFADIAVQRQFGNYDLRRLPFQAAIMETENGADRRATAEFILKLLKKQDGKVDASVLPVLARIATAGASVPDERRRGAVFADFEAEFLEFVWELCQRSRTPATAECADAMVQLAEIYIQGKMPERAETLCQQVQKWSAANNGEAAKSISTKADAVLRKLGKAPGVVAAALPPPEPGSNSAVAPRVESKIVPAVSAEREWAYAYYAAVMEFGASHEQEKWTRALEIAESFPASDPRRLEALEHVSKQTAFENNSDRAFAAAEKWLEASRRLYGEKHVDTLRARARIAELTPRKTGDFTAGVTAGITLGRAVIVDAENAGLPQAQLAFFRFDLAMRLLAAQKYTEAEPLFKKGLEEVQNNIGYAGFSAETILSGLEKCVMELKTDSAPSALRARYAKWESAEKSAWIWTREYRCGFAAYAARVDCGLKYFINAAKLARETFEPGDERTLKTLNAGVDSALAVGNYPQAITFIEQLKEALNAVPVATRNAQDAKLGWAQILLKQADITLATGDVEAVEMELFAAQAKLDAELNPNTATAAATLCRLVRAIRYQRKDGESMAKKNLALNETQFGTNSPQVLEATIEYFEQTLRNGKLTEAEELEKRIAANLGHQAGPSHVMRKYRLLQAQADVQLGKHAFAEAATLFQSALALIDAAKSPLSIEHGDLILGLAKCQRGMNQLANAEKSLQEALEIQRRIWSADNPRVTAIFEELLGVYKDQKKTLDAARIDQTLKYIKAFKAAHAQGGAK